MTVTREQISKVLSEMDNSYYTDYMDDTTYETIRAALQNVSGSRNEALEMQLQFCRDRYDDLIQTIRKQEIKIRDLVQNCRDVSQQWQPIETAPQDRPILVYGGEIDSELSTKPRPLTEWTKVKYNRCIKFDEDCNEIGGWDVCDTCYYQVTVINPTHWMTLPTTPSVSDSGDDYV